ncbi:unnamed protein product [Rotaria magnacalcarata]|uniref:Methenyltetrahydrofolate cyclohydrolase n=1 Tax=Rotaria magnacalcarata TaxID=392030 RepID=A0A816WYM9_9BILA|nr:unnamed protein product [Rotaria magnacalcarata]CAF4500627.1 unnamed protein product [Rotaria magnacalcarata]
MFHFSIKHIFKFTLTPSRFLVTHSARAVHRQNNILHGKPIAERILNRCKNECEQFNEQYHRRPKLVAILVGGNESSKLYVRNKQRIAEHVGIAFQAINHLMHIAPSNLIDTINRLNNDGTVDGIIVQLPLPLHLVDKTENFIDAIRSDKDVDGHTTSNYNSYRHTSIPPITIPVVAVVREILLEINEPLQGKDVVIIGRSKYVDTPLALMLSQSMTDSKSSLISGATVTICHRDTHLNNLTRYCKNADIVISAVGRAKMVQHRMIKEGAVVIDVEVKRVARWITPVPGDMPSSEST